ncbi:unnamed protein product [Symbiodinium sp. CCMP2592]|nr:unnamed protein product [Symbiodinium sp. CCMP2592]
MAVDSTGGSPSRSKRAREPGEGREARPRGAAQGRAFSPGGDQPVTSREFRDLLNQHLHAITRSWQEMDGRVGAVEERLDHGKKESAILISRVTQVERKEADLEVKVTELSRTVAAMQNGGEKPAQAGGPPWGEGSLDPWAQFRARKGSAFPAAAAATEGPPRGGREELSDDDKKTLIIGGWMPDSRRQLIIDEGKGFLERDEIKNDLDQTELTVWGPRRAFAVLKFKQRDGEEIRDVRNRMWKIIQNLRATPHRLPSTAGSDGLGRPMWAQFTKTREARRRASHGSMLRRVCTNLVKDAEISKEAHNISAKEDGAYDIDWTSGTAWHGELKLGSSSHRAPKGDSIKLLSSGWVDIMAVARATGVQFDIALGAIERVDAVSGTLDFLTVQEMPRAEEGWGEEMTDSFVWLSHRSPSQWRGVGVGISQDIFDCCTDKVCFDKGAAWLVKFRNSRRLVLASLHLPTGVPTRLYHAAVQDFRARIRRWHPDVPCFLGVDVNEVVDWTHADENEDDTGVRAGAKIDKFLEATEDLRCRLVAPVLQHRWSPTHFPRDESREGRHIDAILVRQLHAGPVRVNADVRIHINTDHARLECDLDVQATSWGSWIDSRPRWVKPGALISEPHSWDDVVAMAKQCTEPRQKHKYVDSDEIRDATERAKACRGPAAKALWNGVHRLRRRARRAWKLARSGRILAGDWHAYREAKAESKRRCWWGGLLRDKSAQDLADAVTEHLESKVSDPLANWHSELDERLQNITCCPVHFAPISSEEVGAALLKMRARSALGPDGVSVDLLKVIFAECPDALLRLLNETLFTGAIPEKWGESLLALLPKVACPQAARELRPIAMSCSGMKLLSKIVMNRTFRRLREHSPWSACGQNRGTADLHGVMGRLRDMTREWRLGVLVVKLDIEGAFDYVNRGSVADFIQTRLSSAEYGFEQRFLLRLLDENLLRGVSPGGGSVRVKCNRGIRQGSPESAEIFGMLISDVINRLKHAGQWKDPVGKLRDVPADVGTYQDDIFVWSDTAGILEKNIARVAAELRHLGLKLAVQKTCVIASKYYKGRRVIKVDGTDIPVQESGCAVRVLGLDYDLDAPAASQARELHGRVWGAFHDNKAFICGPGSWQEKHRLVQMLVEGSWSWSAGAVHWEKAELQMMNSTQLRVLRLAFGIRRLSGEDWVSYNARSLRQVRLWLAQTGAERWSTKVLRLQFQLAGHWMRQVEGEDGKPGLAGRMMLWRSMSWWNHEKSLTSGARHPMRFRAANLERSLASCLGEKWYDATYNREGWKQLLPMWIAHADVAWDIMLIKIRALILLDGTILHIMMVPHNLLIVILALVLLDGTIMHIVMVPHNMLLEILALVLHMVEILHYMEVRLEWIGRALRRRLLQLDNMLDVNIMLMLLYGMIRHVVDVGLWNTGGMRQGGKGLDKIGSKTMAGGSMGIGRLGHRGLTGAIMCVNNMVVLMASIVTVSMSTAKGTRLNNAFTLEVKVNSARADDRRG